MSNSPATGSLLGSGRSGAVRGALALVLLSWAGCRGNGAAGTCENLDRCGAAPGSPVGVWQVTDVCRFPVVNRPAQNYDTTRGYFQPETGVTPPAMTSGPWCFDISFDKDGKVLTPANPPPNPDYVVSGTVTFQDDHTYLYDLTAISTTKFHLDRSCFGVGGAKLTCDQLAANLLTSPIGVVPTYANAAGTPPFRCSDATDGCDCEFDYIETDSNGSAVGDRGMWAQEGDVIHHYSISGQGNLFETSPSRRIVRDATFCQDGDTMQLTGTNGQPIALKAGTRTLFLKRAIPDAGAGGAGGAGGTAGGAGGEGGADGAAGAGGAGGTTGVGGSDGGDDAASDAAAGTNDAASDG